MINEPYRTRFQSKDEYRKLADDILRKGAVCLPSFFDQETYDRVLDYSQSLTNENRYDITFRAGTPAMDIAQSDEFMEFFDGIHEARCHIQNTPYVPLKKTQQAVSLPTKDGSNSVPTPFHFDDSYVNAVFAMKMPTNSKEGHLHLYPNFRNRIRPLFF